MSSEARFIRKNTCGARRWEGRCEEILEIITSGFSKRKSDSAALFSGSPENPAVSKEMVARKIEIKYCLTIYRVIIAHRDPMTRSYSKKERYLFFSPSMCGMRKKFSFGKVIAIITFI